MRRGERRWRAQGPMSCRQLCWGLTPAIRLQSPRLEDGAAGTSADTAQGLPLLRGPGERPLSLRLGEALPLCPPEAAALGLEARGQSRPWWGSVVPAGLLPPPGRCLPCAGPASLRRGRHAAPHPLPRGGAHLPRGPGPSMLPLALQTRVCAQEAGVTTVAQGPEVTSWGRTATR